MKRLVLPLVLLAVLPLLSGAAKNAWDTWREGYVAYQKGEAARDRGEFTLAYESFRKSLELYREIQRSRPDWDQNIIRQRIADSERELEKVRQLLGVETPSASPEPVAPVEPPAAARGVDFVEQESRKRELEIYRKKIVDLSVESDQLRKEVERLKGNEVDALKLLREQRVLRENATLLEQQVKALEKQLQEPDTRVEELRKQLIEEKMNSDLLAKRLQLAEARAQKLDKEAVDLNRGKGLAEAAAKANAEDVTRLNREMEELRRFRDDAQKQRTALEAAAAEAELKLKNLNVKQEKQAADLAELNRRLTEAATAGGGAGKLNAELLAENAKLKAETAAARKALDASAEELLALQNKHRAAQLEVVQLKETAQRIEVLRLALEKGNAELVKELEREHASGELTTVELKNLRERNIKLEADMKSWSERCAKLEEQLKTQSVAANAGITRSEDENSKLLAELKLLKAQLKTQDEEFKVLSAQNTSRAEALETANGELKKTKSELLLTDEKLEKAKKAEVRLAETEARLAKLEPELESLRKDVPAMRKQLTEAKLAAEELKTSQTALEAAKKRLAELEKISGQLIEEQKNNQALTETSRALTETSRALTEKNRALSGEIAKLRDEVQESRRIAAEKPAAPPTPTPPPTAPVLPSGVTAPLDLKPAELIAAGQKEEAAERWELAVWNYEAALAREPENAEAARMLGELLLRRGEFARAEPLLARAARRNPNDTAMAAACAEALVGQGKFGNALAVLEKSLKLKPNDFRLRLTLAKALAGSGKKEAAEKEFNAAAELTPTSPDPQLGLARLKLAGGDEKAAADCYRRARDLGAGPDTELEPKLGKKLAEQRELAEFMSKAAAEAAKNGDWTSALWYYRQLAEIDGNNRRIPPRMAFSHIQAGNYAQALEILAMNPPTTEGDLVRVVAYLKQGKYADARKAAEEALKRNGDKPLQLAPGWPELAQEFAALSKKPELSQSVAGMECSKVLLRLIKP